MSKPEVWIIEWKPGSCWEPYGDEFYTAQRKAQRDAKTYNHNDALTAYRARRYVSKESK